MTSSWFFLSTLSSLFLSVIGETVVNCNTLMKCCLLLSVIELLWRCTAKYKERTASSDRDTALHSQRLMWWVFVVLCFVAFDILCV